MTSPFPKQDESLPDLTEAQSTEAWNSLPVETRKALVVHWHHCQIHFLRMEKHYLREMVARRIREIDQHIKNIEDGIRRG